MTAGHPHGNELGRPNPYGSAAKFATVKFSQKPAVTGWHKSVGRTHMKFATFSAAFGVALLASTSLVFAQGRDTSGDDSNATAGKWPLAAKAGVDSHADKIAPPGAVNQGPFNMDTWKRGHTFDPPAGGSPIWNPV
jgi:hypothetical protein